MITAPAWRATRSAAPSPRLCPGIPIMMVWAARSGRLSGSTAHSSTNGAATVVGGSPEGATAANARIGSENEAIPTARARARMSPRRPHSGLALVRRPAGRRGADVPTRSYLPAGPAERAKRCLHVGVVVEPVEAEAEEATTDGADDPGVLQAGPDIVGIVQQQGHGLAGRVLGHQAEAGLPGALAERSSETQGALLDLGRVQLQQQLDRPEVRAGRGGIEPKCAHGLGQVHEEAGAYLAAPGRQVREADPEPVGRLHPRDRHQD